ncbi:uncharacterized protein G2W53_017809 [Senna tora]|uniref:Uncharacterized protein n=1 Tax=Senna tora TaxID=362788 RepID=A0A834TUS1_9FABA|nr:uncharacterized protein G2W53_017809 [Senna tora]
MENRRRTIHDGLLVSTLVAAKKNDI